MTVETRFWAKVDKNGPVPEACPELGPCWMWTGAKLPNGCGNIHARGRPARAPRVSYEIAYGSIPVDKSTHHGICVLHRCDVPACVNPRHLFLGTQQVNMADMVAKGRHVSIVHPERLARGERNGQARHPERTARGERNASAKLSEVDVREIQRRRAAGELHTAIAATFNVSYTTISKICRRKSWAHSAPSKEIAEALARTKKVRVGDEEHTCEEWSRRTGISACAIRSRLAKGWSVERAVTEPVPQAAMLEWRGVSRTIKEWSLVMGLDEEAIRKRLRRGWTVERTLESGSRRSRKLPMALTESLGDQEVPADGPEGGEAPPDPRTYGFLTRAIVGPDVKPGRKNATGA